MDQRDFWNSVAGTKRFTHAINFDEFDKYVDIGSRILDYGCGEGRLLKQLNGLAYTDLTGMDFSHRMLELARQSLPGAILLGCEGVKVPAEDASFDAVLLFTVLTCIHGDQDQKALIAELTRVLRPGGILYISDCLLNEDPRNRERYEKYEAKYGRYGVFELPEGAVVRHHSIAWIDEITAPFIVHHFRTFEAETMNGNRTNAFQTIVRKK